MKHLTKSIAVFWFSILFILLSIKSSYAAETYALKNIEATTTKTVDLNFDKKITKDFTQSDLEIYKSIDNKATRVENEKNKIVLELNNNIEKNSSYSLISLSSIEWNIIFKTGDDILLKEIENTDLENGSQWIKSILIKDSKHLVLTFSQNINSWDLEFQLLKSLEVQRINTIANSSKIKAILKWELLNNEQYLWTLTFLETNSFEKADITKWINYFKTGNLAKYTWPTAEELNQESVKNNDKELEKSLIDELNKSSDLNRNETNKIKEELNSAAQDPANKEKTQLEKLALSQKETPETGAETWIILLATFIINTFYYISRRKSRNVA